LHHHHHHRLRDYRSVIMITIITDEAIGLLRLHKLKMSQFIKNTDFQSAVPQAGVSIFSKNLTTTSKFWSPEG
jgi:hypothetical protein